MILDSSLLISAIERRSPAAVRAIRELGRPSIRSFVVDGELTAGIETARELGLDQLDVDMREATRTAYIQLSEAPHGLKVDTLSAHFSRVSAMCSLHRPKVGQNDRWILAEALALGTIVLTCDERMHELGLLIGARHSVELVRLIPSN